MICTALAWMCLCTEWKGHKTQHSDREIHAHTIEELTCKKREQQINTKIWNATYQTWTMNCNGINAFSHWNASGIKFSNSNLLFNIDPSIDLWYDIILPIFHESFCLSQSWTPFCGHCALMFVHYCPHHSLFPSSRRPWNIFDMFWNMEWCVLHFENCIF